MAVARFPAAPDGAPEFGGDGPFPRGSRRRANSCRPCGAERALCGIWRSRRTLRGLIRRLGWRRSARLALPVPLARVPEVRGAHAALVETSDPLHRRPDPISARGRGPRHASDPNRHVSDPRVHGAAGRVDSSDPRGENSDPICGVFDPIRGGADPRVQSYAPRVDIATDRVDDSTPRVHCVATRVGNVDPRVRIFTTRVGSVTSERSLVQSSRR
jgi:hypothetical protein